MTRPPTEKQLAFLQRLKYSGIQPATVSQASAAIDALLDKKGSKAAEAAIEVVRKEEAAGNAMDARERLSYAKQAIREQIRENREFGDEGLYCGFLFYNLDECDAEILSVADRKYCGAFLPLHVAEKHPELLATDGLEYEEVLVDDELPRGAPMIVAPGQLTTTGKAATAGKPLRPAKHTAASQKKPGILASCGGCLMICGIGIVGILIAPSLFGWLFEKNEKTEPPKPEVVSPQRPPVEIPAIPKSTVRPPTTKVSPANPVAESPTSARVPEKKTPALAKPSAETERKADSRLRLARQLLGQGKEEAGKRWLKDVVKDYPGTRAAEEAAKQLESLIKRFEK